MKELEDLAEEVDFTDGVRGRFAGRPGRDILTVTLYSDVAQAFRTLLMEALPCGC